MAVRRAKKDKPESPMVDMILNLLKQTKNTVPDTPTTSFDVEKVLDSSNRLYSDSSLFLKAVSDKNYDEMAKLLLELQHNVIRNVCLVGMTSCYTELTKRHHSYKLECASLTDAHALAKVHKSYNRDVTSVLHSCGLDSVEEDPSVIDHVMESLEIFVATTCAGCINDEPRNHESHTNDVQCKIFRRNEIEKRGKQRRKNTAAGAVGSAPPPKGRTGKVASRPQSFPGDIDEDSAEEVSDGEDDMDIDQLGDRVVPLSRGVKLERKPNKKVRVAVWIFNDNNTYDKQFAYLGDYKEWTITSPVFCQPQEGESTRKCAIRAMNVFLFLWRRMG